MEITTRQQDRNVAQQPTRSTSSWVLLGMLCLLTLIFAASAAIYYGNPGPRSESEVAHAMMDAQIAAFDDGIVVERRVALPWLPSASGMAPLGPNCWLVAGDDASDLFLIDSAGKMRSRIPLPHQKHVDEDGRVPKAMKRDYEAIASWDVSGERHFLVFGSGSKIPNRSWIIWGIWANDALQFHEYEASAFYQQLLLQGEMLPESLNVEGAVVMGDRLILLNREDNLIFSIDIDEFIQFIQNQDLKISIDVGQVALPKFAGVVSGLSGACTDSTGDRLYFSASIEDRSGTLQDGQILGSSIGWVDLGDTNAQTTIETLHLVDAGGNRTFDKLEALEILRTDSRGMHLLGITDSDDGGSELLEIFIPAKYLPTPPALPFGRKP